jgi:signal transduction histidine kinase
MESQHGNRANQAPNPTEIVARTLRHEVGDLLQTVYASVAILQERLSKDLKLERRILGDLRGRAETCKRVLDTVHDLVCPLSLTHEPLPLSELAASLVTAISAQYPQLEVRGETPETPPIRGDQRYLSEMGSRLLASACQRAHHQVVFRSVPGPGPAEVEWSVADDGPDLAPDQLNQLLDPFQTTRPSVMSLDLGLANRIVKLHGGRMIARVRPGGGLVVEVVFPVSPTNPAQ